MNDTDNSSAKTSSFNFFINLFDNGEFNELVVTKGTDGYQVNLDNEAYLGTLARNSDHSWRLVNGNIPAFVINKIIQGIDRKLNN